LSPLLIYFLIHLKNQFAFAHSGRLQTSSSSLISRFAKAVNPHKAKNGDFKMKLISSLTIVFALIHTGNTALAGEYCGSKEGYLNQITSAFIIPDFFPPETEALRGLISKADYERCSRIAFAYLGASCQAHDDCYDARISKESCDKELQDAWVKACRSTYYKLTFDSQTCRLACESFVKLMSEAQRYDSDGVCPSCEAYN
jgi:hypothetical protein